MRKIILGGHWCEIAGWEIYNESQADITKKLPFADNSVDYLFTEHVIEHVYFHQGVDYFKDAFRVLKQGAHIRTVCPFIDVIYNTAMQDKNGKEYADKHIYTICLAGWYKGAMDSIGISIYKHARVFSLLNQYHCFTHKFMWDTLLMIDCLSAIGYINVKKCDVGKGIDNSLCVERPRRGIYSDTTCCYDCEGTAIEATKP